MEIIPSWRYCEVNVFFNMMWAPGHGMGKGRLSIPIYWMATGIYGPVTAVLVRQILCVYSFMCVRVYW